MSYGFEQNNSHQIGLLYFMLQRDSFYSILLCSDGQHWLCEASISISKQLWVGFQEQCCHDCNETVGFLPLNIGYIS